MALKLGYKASAEQFPPRRLLDYSVEAERLGLEIVGISDHFQPFRHTGGHGPACLPWLGALGERTENALIGTSVLTPTMRYHPSMIAQAFATLACLSPGRVWLGVGTGESINETPATGAEWPGAKERRLRLAEAIDLMRRLWSEERVSFEGQYYRTEKATIYDKPDQPVPIYVAAAGPQVAKYAGRSGQGFICTSGKAWKLYTETLLPNVEEGLKLASNPPADYDRLIEMKVSFDTDRERAMQDTRHWAALALTPEEKMSVEDPVEMEKLADALPVERAASRWIVSNDADEHIEKIRPYIEMGFRHLVFHAPGPAQERFLRLYGEQILP